MTQNLNKLALAAALLAAYGSAMAQSAGTWAIKGGINTITPQVSSGDLSAPSMPGSKVDVKADTTAIVTATYFVTDATSVEFFAGLPYKHDVIGAGALAGVGKIGSVKQVSPTIFGQYRFLTPSALLRPYVGLGVTYAHFYGEEGSGTLTALTNPGGPPTKISASSAWGLSAQLGATFKLGDRWYLDASVVKSFIKNETTLSTGQSVKTKLDPLSTGLSVGYMF